EVGTDLGGQRRRRAQAADGVDADPRAAHGVVGAAFAIGGGAGAVAVGQVFGPDQAGIGGELADEGAVRAQHLDQYRAEVTAVGQAVAEENRLREGRIL